MAGPPGSSGPEQVCRSALWGSCTECYNRRHPFTRWPNMRTVTGHFHLLSSPRSIPAIGGVGALPSRLLEHRLSAGSIVSAARITMPAGHGLGVFVWPWRAAFCPK